MTNPVGRPKHRTHEEICARSTNMRPIQELTANHDLMVTMLVGDGEHPPATKTEVAEVFSVSKDAITAITSSPLFSKKMRERRAILQESVEAARSYYQGRMPQLAVEAVDMALHCDNPAVKGAMIRDSLDRGGLAAKTEIDIKAHIVTATYSEEELRRVLIERLNQSGMNLDDLIEGEVEPVE